MKVRFPPLDLLVQHRDRLRHLQPDNEGTRRVQNLVEEGRKLVDEKTAQVNRLIGYLKIYFPQMLQWFTSMDTKLVCDFLGRWSSLEELKKVRPAELRKFLGQRQGRHHELTEGRIQGIVQAMPAIQDRAVIEAKQAVVQVIAQQLRSLLEGTANLDRKIAEAARVHPDFFIFESLPGAGAPLAPRLLAALGSQRDRYDNPDEVQKHSGIAPVTETSGKKKWVHFMNGRATRLRSRSGPAPITSNSANGARTTRLRCEPWPSNGFASCFAAGKIACLMTRKSICRHGEARLAPELASRRSCRHNNGVKLLWIPCGRRNRAR